MQRISLVVLLLLVAVPPCPAAAADSAAAPSELRLVAYGTLQKRKTSAGDSYLLVDKAGQTTYSLQPAGQLALEPHVGKQVEVVGQFEAGQASEKRLLAEAVRPSTSAPPAHFVELRSVKAADKSSTPPLQKIEPRPSTDGTSSAAASPLPLLPDPPASDGPLLIAPDGSAAPEEIDAYAPVPADGSWHVAPCGPPERLWVRAEALWWWTRSLRLPALATTSPLTATPDQAGVLGEDGAQVVFGNQALFEEVRRGGRLRLGGWLGQRRWLGLEFDYTGLEDEESRFQTGSYQLDILARPFNNYDAVDLTNRGPDASLLVYPNVIDGYLTIDVYSRFQSGGAHLLGNIWCNHGSTGAAGGDVGTCNGFRLDLIGGYRYIQLEEGVLIRQDSIVQVVPRAGVVVQDQFRTSNDFHAGEIGLQGLYRRGRWWTEGLLKLAIGRTEEKVSISGNTELVVPPHADDEAGVEGPVEFPGGLLAQTTNMGQYSRKEFAVAPEIGVTFGYRITPSLNATLGYSLIYLSRAVRPRDTIDLNVNPAYVPPPDDPLTGPSLPAFTFADGDFWAQGLNLGLDYRW